MSEDHAGFSISTALSGPRANIDKTMGTVSIDIFCASIRKQQTIAKGDANPAFEISFRHRAICPHCTGDCWRILDRHRPVAFM